MAALLMDVVIRASLIAASTAAVLWALRIKTAATRHAAWTFVVIAMLLLPAWSAAGLKLPVRVLRAPAPSAADTFDAPVHAARIAQADGIAPPSVPERPAPRPFDWQRLLTGVYLAGAGLLLARLIAGTICANRLRRAAFAADGRATSDRCATPITVGFFRPALILPASWRRWPSGQLNAVLTHEGEHVRRHDPLVQWLALANRAVFWFHPLSWWLERRLATLAEEACDAAVLAAGHSPEDYSEYLLEMARAISRQGHRVRPVGMAMPGSGLAPRVRQILNGVAPPPVSRSRAVWTVALCAISSGLFAAGTLDRVSQSTASAPASPAFEVASIKINKSGDQRAPSLIQPGGRFTATNNTLRSLILNAYDIGSVPDLLQGGPPWIDSERFDVDARAASGAIPPSTQNVVLWRQTRLMLRRLLEDRFKLAVHRESKVLPVYRLTALPKRPALKKTALDCTDVSTPCHGFSGNPLRSTGTGVDMDDVARWLTLYLGRPVINDTGIDGTFDLTLQWNPFAGRDVAANASSPAGAASSEGAKPDAASLPDVATALQQQLGVKLTDIKAPVDVYVIDGVQHLVPDDAFPAVAPAGVVTKAPGGVKSQFDVASVKDCTDPPAALAGRRGGLKTIGNTANRLYLDCITLETLADLAYTRNGDFVLNEHIEGAVRGGPDWIRSDRFTLEATAAGAPGADVLMGSMLRALLEDRFKLRVHADSIDVPMYALTVAKGGLKIKPMADGDCAADDPDHPAPPSGEMFAAGKKPPCGSMRGTSRGSVRIWDFGGISMADLATSLDADREILDQTGVTGRFLIHLEYERDEKAADGVNLFAALEQQLGLKLVSTKGPHKIAVIDRVERPRPDAPAESAIVSTQAVARARR